MNQLPSFEDMVNQIADTQSPPVQEADEFPFKDFEGGSAPGDEPVEIRAQGARTDPVDPPEPPEPPQSRGFIDAIRRGWGKGREDVEADAFRQGFGDVSVNPLERVDKKEVEAELGNVASGLEGLNAHYFNLRNQIYGMFSRHVPDFDLSQDDAVGLAIHRMEKESADDSGITAQGKQQFSEAFNRAFVKGFLPNAQKINRLLGSYEDLVFRAEDSLVDVLGVGQREIREADNGVTSALGQFRRAFSVAEEIVQRPVPFDAGEWDEYIELVERAVEAVQFMLGGMEQAIVGLRDALKRGKRAMTKLRGPQSYIVRKFSSADTQTVQPEEVS